VELAKARLQLAPVRKDWTAGDFQRVKNRDECSIGQQPAWQQRWVFSMPGPERWQVDCVSPLNLRHVKLIVWGYIWGKQRGPSVRNRPDRPADSVCQDADQTSRCTVGIEIRPS